jgi:hypothetical protein
MKMEQIECSETTAYKIQTPGNHPEENIQHTEQGLIPLPGDLKLVTTIRFNFILRRLAKRVLV